MTKNQQIMGTIEINEDGWMWDTNNLKESDLIFLEKVNPSSAITFKRHLQGAEECEKHISNHTKFLKCLKAVKQI